MNIGVKQHKNHNLTLRNDFHNFNEKDHFIVNYPKVTVT